MLAHEAFGLDTWRLLQKQGLPAQGYVTQLHGDISPKSVLTAYHNESTVRTNGPQLPTNDFGLRANHKPNTPQPTMNLNLSPGNPSA